MRSLTLLAVIFGVSSGYSQEQAPELPAVVSACLTKHPEVELNHEQRPAYLKVHFNSAVQLDFLVAVLYRGKRASRALLCRADGSSLILGVPGSQPFSDMYNDDYMSSEWRRCTRSELQRMAKYYRGVPTPDNESVCFTWEDGESVIYQHRGRILWKDLRP